MPLIEVNLEKGWFAKTLKDASDEVDKWPDHVKAMIGLFESEE